MWKHGWILIPANPFAKPYPNGFLVAPYLEPRSLPRYLYWRSEKNPAQFQRDCSRYSALLKRLLKPRWRHSPVGSFHSCEYLWRLPRRQISRLRSDFENLGVTRFLVVAYVRDPISMYGSALQQWSRMSSDLRRFDPMTWRYEFRKRLESWRDVFGADLVVRPLIRSQLYGQSVVSDLHHTVVNVLGDQSGFPDLLLCDEANSSYPLEALLAMQDLFMRYPGFERVPVNVPVINRLWKKLADLKVGIDGQTMSVRTDLKQLVLLHHSDDLTWLRAHYGIYFSDLIDGNLPLDSAVVNSFKTPIDFADFLEGSPRREVLEACKSVLQDVYLERSAVSMSVGS